MGWKFSKKQRRALTWWCSPGLRDREAVICDGAVRSGKTLCMGLGFFCWAMGRFRGQRFGLCGRSVHAVRRNLLDQVLPLLGEMGFEWEDRVSQNRVTVRFGGRENVFWLFGGRDEGSGAAIQGVTLAGVLLDEVALMPRSFVEQAVARCSVEGAKLWFNCNPDTPGHWFYQEWILKREERRALYLRFRMEDNPGLSQEVLERYRRNFQGVFYRRFILGEWAAAEGLVYPFFDESYLREAPEGCRRWCISCDYGTVNPASFGLWGWKEGVWYRVKEFYHDARRAGRQKTDGEYVGDLAALAGGRDIEWVVVDPSAASFMEALRREGWRVRRARNEVVGGIRVTAELLKAGRLVICRGCGDTIREMGLYRWDQGGGMDRVVKEHDHAMDDMRYFAATIAAARRGDGFAAKGVERGRF